MVGRGKAVGRLWTLERDGLLRAGGMGCGSLCCEGGATGKHPSVSPETFDTPLGLRRSMCPQCVDRMVATRIKMVTFLYARLSTKLLMNLAILAQSCLLAACYMWASRGRRTVTKRQSLEQKL